MNLIKSLSFIFLVLLSGCTQMKEKVDLIVFNANIYTIDDAFTAKEAMAIKKGMIRDIGSTEDILSKYSSANTINAQKNSIYPGLIDGHCHFYGMGVNLLRNVDLKGTLSFEEIIEKLLAFDNKYNPNWLVGRGWDQNDWERKEFPTNEMLNKAFPDKPVYLTRIDGHAAIVNQKALEMAGINSTSFVSGGDFIKKGKELTGVLIDNAMGLISDIIPEPTVSEKIHALRMAEKECLRYGLTSVVDAGLETDMVKLIDSLHQSGTLEIRINAMLSPTKENISEFVLNGPYVTERLTVRSIKLYADGALGSRGAKMLEPYSDDEHNHGLMMHEDAYYDSLCLLAYNNGYQVNTHAIGDAGVRFTLNTYARYLKGENDLRWRVEHAQIVHPDDFNIFGEFSIIPSVQPTHATSDMYWADERVGEERMNGAYAFHDLLEQNNWIISGTDFPIEEVNPLLTYYAAVARQDLNRYPESGFQMENALTPEECMRSMTIWAAKGSFEENEKGSLEVGKVADFIITDKDILNCDIHDVPEIKVLQTFISGKLVYSADNK